MSHLLTVEHLCVTYETDGAPIHAVDDVSFTVEPGEVLALVGGSGSGKSSVALAITRLLPPTARVSGCVKFEQRRLLELPEGALRAIRGGMISYVFQEPASALNPVLTVGSQIVEAMAWHTASRGADARGEAKAWLERVGIPSAAARLTAYPHEFSGGMLQRACLAMALSTGPRLLIADEPTTALDVTVQVQILRLLRDLQRTLGLSVLLISHDLTVVERIAHRVGVMADGRLVECGSVAQVLRGPTHPVTQQLVRYRSMMALPRPPATSP